MVLHCQCYHSFNGESSPEFEENASHPRVQARDFKPTTTLTTAEDTEWPLKNGLVDGGGSECAKDRQDFESPDSVHTALGLLCKHPSQLAPRLVEVQECRRVLRGKSLEIPKRPPPPAPTDNKRGKSLEIVRTHSMRPLPPPVPFKPLSLRAGKPQQFLKAPRVPPRLRTSPASGPTSRSRRTINETTARPPIPVSREMQPEQESQGPKSVSSLARDPGNASESAGAHAPVHPPVTVENPAPFDTPEAIKVHTPGPTSLLQSTVPADTIAPVPHSSPLDQHHISQPLETTPLRSKKTLRHKISAKFQKFFAGSEKEHPNSITDSSKISYGDLRQKDHVASSNLALASGLHPPSNIIQPIPADKAKPQESDTQPKKGTSSKRAPSSDGDSNVVDTQHNSPQSSFNQKPQNKVSFTNILRPTQHDSPHTASSRYSDTAASATNDVKVLQKSPQRTSSRSIGKRAAFAAQNLEGDHRYAPNFSVSSENLVMTKKNNANMPFTQFRGTACVEFYAPSGPTKVEFTVPEGRLYA